MTEVLAENRNGLICMVGTDHGLAPADVRSALSLPAEVREEAVLLARAKLGASGVVLLATCNRTELWASFDGVEPPARALDEQGVPTADDPMVRAICEMHLVDPACYACYFVCRSGDAAVEHLFNVACGLRSAIVAEDQVVSQVKQAIAYAREIEAADSVLEVLFRQAVTAAKRVKGSVRFTRAHATAVDQAVAMLARDAGSLDGVSCMVIGNGEYGRLAASALVERGAKVLVTVRRYTHGAPTVPYGCVGVPYADRYGHLGRCKVVMSATTSPHYTLERDAVEGCGPMDGVVFVDLAVPRDIDPAIGELPGCTLFGIDDFATCIGEENAQAVAAAQRILRSGALEFWNWMARRDARAHARPPVGDLFPLFVDLSEKNIVFVGGGTVALRRVRTLLPFAGDVVVCAPDFSPELERIAADGAIRLERACYDSSQLDGADLVFACTNDPWVNDEVHAECKRRGIVVNVCSDRFKCDFYFPGVVQGEGMVVGVSAGGKNHRRVRQVAARIGRLLEEEDV